MGKTKTLLKKAANLSLGSIGLRLINSEWGPRGFADSFQLLKSLGHEPVVIYDVGANLGTWTEECRTVFNHADYYLFEPLPEYSRGLEEKCRASDQIKVFPIALGSKPETKTFYNHADQSSFFEAEAWQGEKIKVRIETIDRLIKNKGLPVPDLIKADIQGYELQMLKGCEYTLERVSFILLEVSWLQIYEGGPYAGEVFGYLASRGFHVFDICSYAARPKDRRLVQSDVLFANVNTGLFKNRSWS